MASTNEQMIGRADVDDVDAILAVTNTEVDEVAHAVRAEADAIFTWDYEQSRKALHKLYEKAKTSQWNANDLPWDDRRRPGGGRGREPRAERLHGRDGPAGHAVREVGRQGVARVRRPVAELDAVAVHAR